MSRISVDEDQLRELIEAALTLSSLEAAGVDNWEGYDFAESPTEEEIADQLLCYRAAELDGKYLFVDGGGVADYAAVSFEQDFKGNRLELWNKAKEAGKTLVYETEDLYFEYEALELDDATVEELQDRMDYDDSKNANYFKVEE